MQQNFKMIPQTTGLHFPLKTLRVLIFHLLLTHFCKGQSHVIGPSQPIVAKVGDDITLPCHLEPAVDVVAMTLEWMRSDLNSIFVYVWRDGQDLVHTKHPSYKERTSLSIDELKHGNISLKLTDVKLSDEGRYQCYIPKLNIQSFVDLVVASSTLSSPNIVGIDRTISGVSLHCQSKGWHPKPEVVWLDGEGNLLSAGPTETVRGPDDLYTVSSRVTVEKRHSNNFTCRVQQKDINQTRETHIQISDDLFEVQPSSSPITVGLAVSLAVCIVFSLFVVLFLWRQNITIKRSNRDETDGEKKSCTKSNKTEDQFVTEEERERQPLVTETVQRGVCNKENGEKKSKHQLREAEQQKREEAQNRVKAMNEDLETEKKEVEKKQSELQQLKEDLENKNKELETILATPVYYRLPLFPGKAEWQRKKKKAEQEVETLKKMLETCETQLDTKIKEVGGRQAEVQQLQDEIQRMETNLQTLMEDLKSNNKKLEDKLAEVQQELACEKQMRMKAEKEVGAKKTEMQNCQQAFEKQQTKLIQKHKQEEVKNLKEELKTIKEKASQAQGGSGSAAQETDTGHINVYEVDRWGEYISLRNMSSKDQQLEGWELHVRVNNRKPIIHTFEDYILKAGDIVNVEWSQRNWGIRDQLLVTLYSHTGELKQRLMLEIGNSQIKVKEPETCLTRKDAATGHITVHQVDPKGNSVTLSNKSIQVQQLEDWELHIEVNNRKPFIYIFPSLRIPSKKTVTIWADGCGGRHNSQTDLVWRNQEPWGTGQQLMVTLFSSTGEEVSMRKVDIKRN